MKLQLSTHPNPAFERKGWQDLNGQWDFAFDRNNAFEANRQLIVFDRKITVPFCYQCELSGINEHEVIENVWYRTYVSVTKEQLKGSVLLHFGAVDNVAKLYVNGAFVGSHVGGFTSFYFDIADYLKEGKNEVVLKAEDTLSAEICRGKQSTYQRNHLCWYENVTGIWQNVWLEFCGKKRVTKVHCTPNRNLNMVSIDIELNGEYPSCQTEIEISLGDTLLSKQIVVDARRRFTICYRFDELTSRAPLDLYWSPEHPNLIDVKVTLVEGKLAQDTVYTYFGLRTISVEKGRIYLNNEPLYQSLVLDQGYYAQSLLTPPNEEMLYKDVELVKAMGFNGARKHQKIDDPRYYYYADKLGLLVWGELPSAYDFTATSRKSLTDTMTEFIERDYNHPCIITWVTINESWGVHRIMSNAEQQSFAKALYYMVKSADSTRLVVSNDGWEQVEETDICTIHDYEATPETAMEKYSDIEFLLDTNAQFRALYCEGARYNGKPIMVTEYGGVKLSKEEGWGYRGDAQTPEMLLEIIRRVTEGIKSNRRVVGYCYTQYSDVFQELNGLVDMHRNVKIPIEQIKAIFAIKKDNH